MAACPSASATSLLPLDHIGHFYESREEWKTVARDHIGHFYESREEWKSVLVPFLHTGLAAGDKCVYFMSAGPARHELSAGLAAAGIDVEHALASQQLVLDEGKTDPQEMQDTLGRALGEIGTRFPLLRWGGDMTWCLKKLPTSEQLMEWESHCNTIDQPRAVFLCQYELTAFLGTVVMDALKTHPLCVVSNAIHQNPYYQEPEAFLAQLRRRETTKLAP